MSHPDEDLPSIQVSLKQFVSLSQALYLPASGQNQDLERFIRFVLAGHIQNQSDGKEKGQLARIFVNAQQGALAPPIHRYQLKRDIDSVIGVTYDLPFKRSMAIFPLACFRDTLTQDNHLKCRLTACEVRAILSGEKLLRCSPTGGEGHFTS